MNIAVMKIHSHELVMGIWTYNNFSNIIRVNKIPSRFYQAVLDAKILKEYFHDSKRPLFENLKCLPLKAKDRSSYHTKGPKYIVFKAMLVNWIILHEVFRKHLERC